MAKRAAVRLKWLGGRGALPASPEAALPARLPGEAPGSLRIGDYRCPRGGKPVGIFFRNGAPPQDLWRPDRGAAPCRRRG